MSNLKTLTAALKAIDPKFLGKLRTATARTWQLADDDAEFAAAASTPKGLIKWLLEEPDAEFLGDFLAKIAEKGWIEAAPARKPGRPAAVEAAPARKPGRPAAVEAAPSRTPNSLATFSPAAVAASARKPGRPAAVEAAPARKPGRPAAVEKPVAASARKPGRPAAKSEGGTKVERLVSLLDHKDGANLEEILQEFPEWNEEYARFNVYKLKGKGYTVNNIGTRSEPVYQIA